MTRAGDRRRLYQEVAEAHWKEWNAKVDRLMEKARASHGDLRKEIDELHRRQYQLTGRLGDLQRASDDTWEPLQEDLDATFASVQKAFGRLERGLKDRRPARPREPVRENGGA